MTTANAPGPWTPWIAKLRHYMIHYMILASTFHVLGQWYLGPEVMTWLGWGPTLMVVPFVASIIAHSRIPACEVCVRKIPLNGSELAERRRFFLQWNHRFWWLLAPFLVINVVTLGVASLFDDRTMDSIMGAIAGSAWVPTLIAVEIHDRLRPWCPWCRRGRDDDEEAPAPTPVPAGTKEA